MSITEQSDSAIAARTAARALNMKDRRTLDTQATSYHRIQSPTSQVGRTQRQQNGDMSNIGQKMGTNQNQQINKIRAPSSESNNKQHLLTSKNLGTGDNQKPNTWNKINSSSSSIALAAASSIAKSNPASLISQKPNVKSSYTAPGSGLNTSRLTNSIVTKKLDPSKRDLPKPKLILTTDNVVNLMQNPDIKLAKKVSGLKVNSGEEDDIKPTISISTTNSENGSKLRKSLSSPNNSTESIASWGTTGQEHLFSNYNLSDSNISINQESRYPFSPLESPSSSNLHPRSAQKFHHHRAPSATSKIKSMFRKHSHGSDYFPYMHNSPHVSLSLNQISNDALQHLEDGKELSTPVLLREQLPSSSSISNQSVLSFSRNGSEFTLRDAAEEPSNRLSISSQSNGQMNLFPPSKQQLNFPSTLRKEKKSVKIGLSRSKAKHKNNGDEFNEDKPWKHHENQATLNIIDQTEKKRYEGVFVTNKGSYMPKDLGMIKSSELKRNGTCESEDSIFDEEGKLEDSNAPCLSQFSDFINTYTAPTERIHGLVVREIWKRSKLDTETLCKIWNLVLSDRKLKWSQAVQKHSCDEELNPKYNDPPIESFDDGTLSRDEFIVGMWIIDQCLYGRKLPKTIAKGVWDSVNSDIFFNTPDMKKWKKSAKSTEGDGIKGKRKLFKMVVGK